MPSLATTALTQFADDLTGGASVKLDFPLFDSPGSIIKLLFGRDVDLVTFNAAFNIPQKGFNFPTGISFLGLSLNFDGQFSAEGSLTLGYDTYGLRELVSGLENGGSLSAGQITSDIADGFYILGPNQSNPVDAIGQPDPLGSYVSVSGTVGLGLGASLGFASINLNGGLFTGKNGNNPIKLSLNDQDPDTANDHRIRLPELASELSTQNQSVFNVSGELDAGLYIQAQVGWGPFSWSDTLVNIATVTLWQASQASNAAVTAAAPPPTVSSVSPLQVPMSGGTTVTISGTDLDTVTSVLFLALGLSGGPLPDTAWGSIVPGSESYASLQVITPPTTQNLLEPAAIVANSPSGSSNTANIIYEPPPTVTGLTGHVGPLAGGTLVDITGTNFFSVTGVNFGPYAAQIDGDPTYTAQDGPTSLWVFSPVCNAGQQTGTLVTVTTGGGTSVPTEQLGDSPDSPAPESFWYILPPNIESISPTDHSTNGDAQNKIYLTLTGTNLDNIQTISLGSVSETPNSVRGNADGTWTVQFSPTQTTSGTVEVTATTAGGTSNPTGDYYSVINGVNTHSYDHCQFTYWAPPTITAVKYAVSGTSGEHYTDEAPNGDAYAVEIEGTNFGVVGNTTGITSVEIGGSAASITSPVPPSQGSSTWVLWIDAPAMPRVPSTLR